MFFYKTRPDARTPTRNTSEDSGWDIYAPGNEMTIVHPGEIVKVDTGLVFACPTAGWVWDKSGRAAKGLKVLGGVIDNFYVGEISIVLGNINLWNIIKLLQEDLNRENALLAFTKAISESTIIIESGKAIAQMVFQPVMDLQECQELPEETFRKEFRHRYEARGTKGFGSSDVVPKLNFNSTSELSALDQLKRLNDSANTQNQVETIRGLLLEEKKQRQAGYRQTTDS